MSKQWSNLWLKDVYEAFSGGGRVNLSGFDAGHPIVENTLALLGGRINLEVLRDDGLPPEGFSIRLAEGSLYLAAADESGLLYGAFHILRQIAMRKPQEAWQTLQSPDIRNRILNHWDNMDGSIESGYAGRSFFFQDNDIIVDERTVDYARLIASVGINGVVINNVNVKDSASLLITPLYMKKLVKLMEIFAGYGIRLYLSLNYAASIDVGGLASADPLDAEVSSWWKAQMAFIYEQLPGLGGFLVKADSEGRPGPFTYGRSQAQGANMLANAIAPHGGVIIWRCFVYNCMQDWRDEKTDRAKAAYDNFIHTDGDYLSNVILQIKNGPMDFQIREPVSPLFGAMKQTNQMLEVQIAQEYTGQQIDVCYLIPMFKEVLDSRTYCADGSDSVFDVIAGRAYPMRYSGICAVSNTGDDENWCGNDLAAANLYGFGRLAWSVALSAAEIAEEWIRLSLSNDAAVVETVQKILLSSRETYEKYTSPLGIGWMVTPHSHYGPAVDGYEYSPWGTYHRADHLGVGVDRSDTGTGYVRQYNEPLASIYNNMDTCPEELLLFFHRVPYTHLLKSGKTLIQHIYDSHCEGVREVEAMIEAWEGVAGKIPEKIYGLVRARLDAQLMNAREWRDQVNTYFYRKSGIASTAISP